MARADERREMIRRFAARNRGRKSSRITEDDPRWLQQLAHGPGQQRKVGANVTAPRAYVTGGSRRGRRYP